MAECFLLKLLSARCNLLVCKLRVSTHQILDDDVHLDRELPLFIFNLAGFLNPVGIFIPTFLAVFLGPLQRSLELIFIINALIHATKNFYLIDRLHTHAKIGLNEILIHDRTADSHGNGTDLQIAQTTERSCRHCRASKTEKHFRYILRNSLVICLLNVPAIHTECRNSLLCMSSQHRCQIYSSGSLGRVQSPDTLDRCGIHIHGL